MAKADSRTPIIIPPVGESVSEGTLAAWLKADGSTVEEGDDILDFESDKATLSVASPAAGILKHTVAAGELVAIGAEVGFVEAASGAMDKKQKARELAQASKAIKDQVKQASPNQGPVPILAPEPIPAPLAAPAPLAEKPSKSVTTSAEQSPSRQVETKPLSALRQALAKRLVDSKQAAAHLSTFNELDMGALKELRSRLGEEFEARHGLKLGYMGFFVRACAMALVDFPEVNASLEGNLLTYHHYVDISVAVSTERGLLTPVIRNAETLGIAAIEKTIKDFATRARSKKIMPDELAGGTFTVSNGGVFGSLLSTPIPNPPQTAVLGLHSIQDRPVVRDGAIVARPMMYLALTYDHRILDGKDAIGFLKRIKDLVEDPARLLLDA